MQNTDAVAWTKKLVGIESTNPGKEEHEIAGFLEQEIRAVLPERGELKKDYTREGRPVLLAVLPGETKEEMVLICHMDCKTPLPVYILLFHLFDIGIPHT